MLVPYEQFWPAQVAALEMPDPTVDIDICHYMGGYGSGKSFIAAVLALVKCSQNEGLKCLIAAEDYEPTVTEAILPNWQERLDEWGLLEGLHYKWYGSKPKTLYLTAVGNAHISYKQLKNASSLRSSQYGFIHIEEANLSTYSAYLQLMGRLRQPNIKKPYRMILTSNPSMARDWLYKEFVETAGIKTYEIDGQKVRINRRRVSASSFENKALDSSYIAMLKGSLSPEQYRALIMGEDIMLNEGLVVADWSFINEDEAVVYNPSLPVYMSCDFNVDPMCWVLAHRVLNAAGRTEYHFFDEIATPATAEQAANLVASKYAGHDKGFIVTGDASGGNRSTQNRTLDDTNYTIIADSFYKWGFNQRNFRIDVSRANPSVMASINNFNMFVKNADGETRVKLNPKNCRWLHYNMLNLKYKLGGKDSAKPYHEPNGNEIKKDVTNSLKHLGHPFDAARYLVSKYDQFRLADEYRPKQGVSLVEYKPSRF
jgi:PBSX family phage terminase large subunit